MTYAALHVALLAVLAGQLAGCAGNPLEIGRAPSLSPVGKGIVPEPASVERIEKLAAMQRQASEAPTPGSLWRDRGADLFRDSRARRIGDILTVRILIKDRASFDNSTKRSRDSSHGFGLNMSHDVDWKGFASAATARADSAVTSSTAQDGKGVTARSENIDLKIAAIVTGVLDNGNLFIKGTQEVLVNHELRLLTFSGIVSVSDIQADNMVSHERVAEARISYGGRGRIMEVQQPAWGHQIVDLLFPF